jgi:tetratricopeptide (TPR) repeat protein
MGKGGEHQIASILGDLALISYPEFDIGFDFFCELLENSQPSGRFFWVQVKTTEKFNEKWSQYIDKKTIKLWLSQFYPVLITLYEKSSDSAYWVSVEEKRSEWGTKLVDKLNTIEVVVNRSQILKKNDENLAFKKIVKRDIVLANAVHGVPHMTGEGYVRSIPVLRLSEVARMNIRHRIRLGLNYLMADSWIRSNLEEAYDLAQLLATFDKNHYDHFLFLARICNTLGRDDEAIKNYDSAIEVCKRDKNWNRLKKPKDASIEEIIETIEKEKTTLNEKRKQTDKNTRKSKK